LLTYAEQQNEARFSREDIYLNGIFKVGSGIASKGSLDGVKVTFGLLRYLILLYHAYLARSDTFERTLFLFTGFNSSRALVTCCRALFGRARSPSTRTCLILLYICPHTARCVLILLHICPYTDTYVSTYCHIYVLILIYMCPHTDIYVSSYCYTRVLILICMCPHTAICVLILMYICPQGVHRCAHEIFFRLGWRGNVGV
jgi:hypothetical protein